MENNEGRFAQILEDIKFQARTNGGYIKTDDVKAAFEDLNLSNEQFEMVFDYLIQNNIGIDEPLEQGEYLSEGEMSILEEYREELKQMDAVSESEKEAYVMAAMNHDASAYDKVISFYLPQVLEISKLYVSQGVALEDLIGEGNLALAEGVQMLGAMESPKEADGMLVKMIMDSMENLIGQTTDENIADQKILDKVNKVADAAAKLFGEFGRKVTVDELVENTSLSRKAVLDAIKFSGNKIEDIEYSEDINAR